MEEISEKRKKELIDEIISSQRFNRRPHQGKHGRTFDSENDNIITFSDILKITDNEDEIIFIRDWLNKNHITVRGLNGAVTDQFLNYEQWVAKIGIENLNIMNSDDEAVCFAILKGKKDEKKWGLEEFNARNAITEGYGKMLECLVRTHPRIQWIDIPEEDKISYATLALMQAIPKFAKFDSKRGYKFIAYAYATIPFMVERACKKELQYQGIDRMSYYNFEFLDMVKEEEDNFRNEGKNPTDTELAMAIYGVSDFGELDREKNANGGFSLRAEHKIEKIREARRVIRRISNYQSLEDIRKDEFDSESMIDNASDGDRIEETVSGYTLDGVYYEPEIQDYVEGYDELGRGYGVPDFVESTVDNQELRDMLEENLSTLTEREARVLKMRYGLDGGGPLTLEDVGRKENVTRERVRQIEAKALRKMRHPARSKKIKIYLDDSDSNTPIRYKRKTLGGIEPRDPWTPEDDTNNITGPTEILRYLGRNVSDTIVPQIEPNSYMSSEPRTEEESKINNEVEENNQISKTEAQEIIEDTSESFEKDSEKYFEESTEGIDNTESKEEEHEGNELDNLLAPIVEAYEELKRTNQILQKRLEQYEAEYAKAVEITKMTRANMEDLNIIIENEQKLVGEYNQEGSIEIIRQMKKNADEFLKLKQQAEEKAKKKVEDTKSEIEENESQQDELQNRAKKELDDFMGDL